MQTYANILGLKNTSNHFSYEAFKLGFQFGFSMLLLKSLKHKQRMNVVSSNPMISSHFIKKAKKGLTRIK